MAGGVVAGVLLNRRGLRHDDHTRFVQPIQAPALPRHGHRVHSGHAHVAARRRGHLRRARLHGRPEERAHRGRGHRRHEMHPAFALAFSEQ